MIHDIQGATVDVASVDGTRARIALAGEFDLDNSVALETALGDSLDGGCTSLTLDASEVTFMDSTILAVLMRLHRRCTDASGTMVLTGVRGNVARLIEATGLDQIIRPGG